MIGLEKFKDYFKGFEDNYVIIGGTACTVLFDNVGEEFRVTKDIDMVIIMENINKDFTRIFWDFIVDAQYKSLFDNGGNKKLYRFSDPKDNTFPKMIELFSRKPIEFNVAKGSHLRPIYIEDDVSSLLAILLNDEYYNFLKSGVTVIDGVSVLDELHLIPFKAKAFCEIKDRIASGQTGQSRHIKKHRNDIFKLLEIIPIDSSVNLHGQVLNDMTRFIRDMEDDEILNQQIRNKELIQLLKDIYLLPIKV